MLLFLLACADPKTSEPTDTDPTDTGPTDTGPVGTPYDGEAPNPVEVIGRIEVVEYPDSRYSRISATLRSGALPTTQRLITREGDCAVIDGDNFIEGPDCDPRCDSSRQSCIEGVCVDWPATAPSGDVTVTGLLPGDVTLEVLDLGHYSTPDRALGDLFEPGDPIRVTSSGGATPALDLFASGVEDLYYDVGVLQPGEPLTFTWTPSSSPSTIQVLVETGSHGSWALTTIWCETEDDGELTIPGALTAYFEIPSCGECGGSWIRRLNRDVVDFGAGPIELMVASEETFVAWWN